MQPLDGPKDLGLFMTKETQHVSSLR